MSTPRHRYEISDEEWERVKEILPPKQQDNRTALNAMLWINPSGAA